MGLTIMEISEKDKKIIASVNDSRGEPKGDKSLDFIIKANKTFSGYKIGDIHHGDPYTDEYWEKLCTAEEYKRCIEDMARADWLSCSVHSNYSFHKLECKNRGIDTSNKKLLKKHCIYDKPLVYTQHQDVIVDGYENYNWKFGCYLLDDINCIVINDSSHMTIPVSRLSVKPILTPEQIKQTIKDEQLKEYTNIIRDACLPVTDKKVKVMLEFLHGKNLLADPFVKLKGGKDE